MSNESLPLAILDSIKDPIIFVDTKHVVRLMNTAAIEYFEEGETLLNKSILGCHNIESKRTILKIFKAMQDGLDEKIITDNEKHRIYMRAVRDKQGKLLGYYERYELP